MDKSWYDRFEKLAPLLREGKVDSVILLIRLGIVHQEDVLHFKQISRMYLNKKHIAYVTANKVLNRI
jgi:hypothetical protein